MKRETLRHPKTYDLASRLGCSRPEAIGYLTLLWDYTAEYATAGDVGKWPNGAISGACDWRGNPDDFIDALVKSGWVDTDDNHRLIVHHWAQHCERWVHLKAARNGISLIGTTDSTTEATIDGTTDATVDATTEATLPCDQSNPIQSNPNQTHPIPTAPPPAANGMEVLQTSGGGSLTDVERAEVARLGRRIATVVPCSTDKMTQDQIVDVAVRCVRGDVTESSVENAIEAVRRNRPKRPGSYFVKCVNQALEAKR